MQFTQIGRPEVLIRLQKNPSPGLSSSVSHTLYLIGSDVFSLQHLPPSHGQVTTLVNTKGPSQKKKGRSKKAQVLVAAVTKSVEHFIVKGEEIALENPEIKNEMLAAVEEVRKTGREASAHSLVFLLILIMVGEIHS